MARDRERAARQGDASQALKTMGQLSVLDEVQELRRQQQQSSNDSILSEKVKQ